MLSAFTNAILKSVTSVIDYRLAQDVKKLFQEYKQKKNLQTIICEQCGHKQNLLSSSSHPTGERGVNSQNDTNSKIEDNKSDVTDISFLVEQMFQRTEKARKIKFGFKTSKQNLTVG